MSEDVTIKNKEGKNALHLSVAAEIGKLLIEKENSLVHVQDNQGNTPLHIACKVTKEHSLLIDKDELWTTFRIAYHKRSEFDR